MILISLRSDERRQCYTAQSQSKTTSKKQWLSTSSQFLLELISIQSIAYLYWYFFSFPRPTPTFRHYLWLHHVCFPGGASDKESACQCRRHQRCQFDSWVGKNLWKRKWQPTPVFLPGKFHGQGSLASYSSYSSKELNMTEDTFMHIVYKVETEFTCLDPTLTYLYPILHLSQCEHFKF